MDGSEDDIFQQLKQAGEQVKAGIWQPQDLDELHSIAHDIADLNAKAAQAEKGGWPDGAGPSTTPPTPIQNPDVGTFRPSVMADKVAGSAPAATPTGRPAVKAMEMARTDALPTLELDPSRRDIAVSLARNQVEVLPATPPPPDPARAAMYRAAAERAADAAVNLAVMRAEASEPDLATSIKDAFESAIHKLIPSLFNK